MNPHATKKTVERLVDYSFKPRMYKKQNLKA